MLFLIVMDCTVTPELYKRAPKNWLTWKLRLTKEIKKFSKNSAQIHQQIIDRETGQCLAQFSGKSVFVSRQTRRTIGLPAWVANIQAGLDGLPSNMILNYTPITDIPSNAFKHPYTMLPSDIDINMHVNNATYVRLCMDVATLACHSHHFTYFRNTILDYDTRRTVMHYALETNVEDQVNIFVWQDNIDEMTLHFVVFHEDAPVYYQDTSFYSTANVQNATLKSKY